MRVALIALALALSGCATAQTTGGVASTRDCAVIGAVLTQHYQIKSDTPYRLDRGNGPSAPDEKPFRIACQFADIPIQDYDHNRPPTPPPNFQSWIKFPTRPIYPDPNTAIVEAGSLLGPLAGSGVKCTLKRESEAWRVQDCSMTWIS